jgi:hypothetical protein
LDEAAQRIDQVLALLLIGVPQHAPPFGDTCGWRWRGKTMMLLWSRDLLAFVNSPCSACSLVSLVLAAGDFNIVATRLMQPVAAPAPVRY